MSLATRMKRFGDYFLQFLLGTPAYHGSDAIPSLICYSTWLCAVEARLKVQFPHLHLLVADSPDESRAGLGRDDLCYVIGCK